MADIIRVTDDSTRAEIAEAMAHLRAAQKRAPKVMADRYSAMLDELLTDWEAAPE